jgi:Putative peptidoglycan binding domain
MEVVDRQWREGEDGTNEADEAFQRSIDALSSLLAARSAAPPPTFEAAPPTDTGRYIGIRSRMAAWAAAALLAAVVGGYYYQERNVSSPPHPLQAAVQAAPPVAAAPPPAATAPAASPTPRAQAIFAERPPLAAAPPSTPVDIAGSKPPAAHVLDSRSIAELQGNLRLLGFDAGPLDGVAGPSTVTAIKKYQQARTLPVTGDANDDILQQVRDEFASKRGH